MDADLQARLDAQDAQLEHIYKSTEATRKYFLWTMIVSIILFVLPLFGLAFVIPVFLNSYASILNVVG